MGLDAKQVVTAGTVLLTNDRFAPTGFQCGLSHQVTRIDANLLGGLLGHRQHGSNKLILRTERGFARRQRWLSNAPAGDRIRAVEPQRGIGGGGQSPMWYP